MPWSTPIPVYIWLPILIALGIFFWKRQPGDRLTIFLLWLDFLAINLIFFFIINWSIVNYYLRFLCLAIPAAVLVRTLSSCTAFPGGLIPKNAVQWQFFSLLLSSCRFLPGVMLVCWPRPAMRQRTRCLSWCWFLFTVCGS